MRSSIIAVHGLNPKSKPTKAHAWDTWRTPAGDDGRLWLRDDLSNTTPNARVFLYEYDATVVYGNDRSSFSDKANRFLEDIRVEREDVCRASCYQVVAYTDLGPRPAFSSAWS